MAYDAGQYESAEAFLAAAAPQDSLLFLYAAVAALYNDRAASAITYLEPLARSATFTYYHSEIAWYLALAYVAEEQRSAAIPLLRELQTYPNPYREKASALLNLDS
jgi:hypothetical protein